jgi:hypothetical protein
MMGKFALFAFCLAFAMPAFAQAGQDNPFREMARRFAEGHDYMQDAQYQNAFDAYFDCYEKAVRDGKPSGSLDQAAADRLFHSAYVSCGPHREAGIKLANERILAFHADMEATERTSKIDSFRRILAVLRLDKPFASIGLGDSFGDYLNRTDEY